MYSVLIVDDDIFARTHLKSLIDWELLGFEIKGDVENGKEAMEFIKAYEPDLVITDMNMPVMDGVTLIRWIQSTHQEIVLIAISGYDDFNYVRSSLQGGAVDYVLKHQLTREHFERTMLSAKQRLESIETHRIQKKDHELLQIKIEVERRREVLGTLILNESTELLSIDGGIKQYGFDYDLTNVMMIIIDLDLPADAMNNPESRMRKIGQLFEELIQNILQQEKGSYYFKINDSRIAVVMSNGSPYSLLKVYNDVYTLVQRIQSSLKRYLNMTACYAVSNIISKPNQLNDAYIRLCAYYEQRFIKGRDQIFMSNEFEVIGQTEITLGYEEEKQLITLLRNSNEEEIHQKIKEIFERLLTQRAERSQAMIISRDLVRIILSVLKEKGIPETSVFDEDNSPYQAMESQGTLVDLQLWIQKSLSASIEQLKALRSDVGYSSLIQQAMNHIHKYYHEDISLYEVAEAVGVSPAHLSRLFKDECGTNYIKYLNEYRIEKAKVLLDENRSFKEVAQMTGFNHYNYFFKVFKDYTQMTPHEYVEYQKNGVHIKKTEL